MLAEVLRRAFALAHQRVGLILLDISWKLVWVGCTAVFLFLAASWIASGVPALSWQDSGRAVNGLIAAAIVRELWNAHKGDMLAALLMVLALSSALWIFLEAFCRRFIVRDLSASENPPVAFSLGLFLTSGIFKAVCLHAAALLLAPVSLAGASVISIVTFLSIAFFLTLLDTLIRADAVVLLGTDLIRVVGLIGILVSFESMVALSPMILLFVGVLKIAGLMDAVVVLAATVAVALFVNLLHSYLLVVRFSAIAIMRQNVVEI